MKVIKFDNGTAYNGDCLEILPQLNTDSCMIAVTSPPYNLGSTLKEKQYNKQVIKKYSKWYDDDLSSKAYRNQQKEVLKELSRVCKSSIFYNHRIQYQWSTRFKNIREKSMISHPYSWLQEFKIWSVIIWDRAGIGMPLPNRYHTQYENIYQINKPVFFDNSKLKLSNIWRIPPTKNTTHPCSFPEKLVNNCLLTATQENDVVIDPYCGGGTVAIQAIKTGRQFIIIEKDKKHFDLCCDRISDEERQYTLF